MSSQSEGYWSRSWALLTRDKGWFKPLLVLAAARMVPIVGSFGADGYGLEWARLTAWGVDSSPKQRGVDVWACIKSGARAFVVALGYAVVIGFLRTPLTALLGPLGSMLSIAVGVFAGVLIMVAKLRATIYQTIGAGYQVQRIYDMVKRDSEGLLRIVGLAAIVWLITFVAVFMLLGVALLPTLGSLVRVAFEYERYGYVDDYYMAATAMSALASAVPALFVGFYLLGIITSGMKLILITSVGLWMRQFDVRNWGESSDPLPQAEPAAANTADAHPYSCNDTPSSEATAEAAAVETVQPLPVMVPDSATTAAKLDDAAAWGLVDDEADAQEALDSLDRIDVEEESLPEEPEQEPQPEQVPEEPVAEFAGEVEGEPEAEPLPAEPEVEPLPEEPEAKPLAVEPELTSAAAPEPVTVPTFSLKDYEAVAHDGASQAEVAPEPADDDKQQERIVEIIDLGGAPREEGPEL